MKTTPAFLERATDSQTLIRLIEKIEFAMFTTQDEEGVLHSRPMETAQADGDAGDLWFLTTEDSPKVREIERMPRVNVTYAQSSTDQYVSVSGLAEIVRDRQRAQDLWSPSDQRWIPKGINDPKLVLIRVHVERAEAWDRLTGKMTPIIRELRRLAAA